MKKVEEVSRMWTIFQKHLVFTTEKYFTGQIEKTKFIENSIYLFDTITLFQL